MNARTAELGRDRRYDSYDIEIARVERTYGFRCADDRPGHENGLVRRETGRS
ncbi:hypothetical protein [Planobispora takensis]|uniref:Uncharacterized protein n=1 Tax=Planobispora takensis TaxID=1367882 RepID=A0A8J3SRT8_9ACTN|nr:hypothetical protein [Planobispora takensis]GIH98174.1 hypothetical protein Pta02_01830 [Planobispora takensis]